MKIDIPDELYKAYINTFPDDNIEEFVKEALDLQINNSVAELVEKLTGEGVGRVYLEQCSTRKIQAIKTIRSYIGCGLKEAKNLSEQVGVLPSAANGRNAELARELKDCGCLVRFDMSPETIVRIRKEYGVTGSKALKEIMNGTQRI